MPNDGLTDFQFDCVVGAAVVALSCFFIAIFWFRYSWSKRNLSMLAARLGFPVTADLHLPAIPREGALPSAPRELGITGTLRGQTVRFSKCSIGYPYTIGTHWEVAVAAPARGFTFTLDINCFGKKIWEVFQRKAVVMGDAKIDHRWLVTANDANLARNLLSPAFLSALDQPGVSYGRCILEHDWLRYEEGGQFFDASRAQRFKNRLDTLMQLAEAIECVTQNFSPPVPIVSSDL